MPAKVSATGVTPYVHGTAPYEKTSSGDEAAELAGSMSTGVKQTPMTYPTPPQAGSKVPGATRTKGGAI
jgi:N-acetylmuramic acid 6-phosphate (MurNAc-6-P) etherase